MYAATHEGALHLDDVLARRTRISIETPEPRRRQRPARSPTSSRRCSAGTPSGSRPRSPRYLARVEAELESQKELADSEANAERLSAPDVRRIPVSRAPEGS